MRCSDSERLGIAEKNLPEAMVSPVAIPRLRAQASPLSRRRALAVHREPLGGPAAQFRRR